MKSETLKSWRCAWIAVLLGLLPGQAGAHEMDWSYIFLSVTETSLAGRLELDTNQLDRLYVADADGDGSVSDSETAAYQLAIENYASSQFQMAVSDQEIPIRFIRHDQLVTPLTSHHQIYFEASVPAEVPQYIDVRYTPFLELDESHRGGLVIENSTFEGIVDKEAVIAAVFAEGRNTATVNLHGDPWLVQVLRFVLEGVWHIWIGLDHVLFLVTLLLTSVLIRRADAWEPVSTFKHALINLVAVVTLFTIAHSITLALAMKEWITLTPRVVESVIALSVLLIALNILKPVVKRGIWVVVFVFGLFHGLGFASVLLELVVTRESKFAALIGFNIGVEIGQLAIVAVVFPILFWLRDQRLYLRFGLPAASLCIAAIGATWFVTRAFDIPV